MRKYYLYRLSHLCDFKKRNTPASKFKATLKRYIDLEFFK
jgi:hypothetical protein